MQPAGAGLPDGLGGRCEEGRQAGQISERDALPEGAGHGFAVQGAQGGAVVFGLGRDGVDAVSGHALQRRNGRG